MSNPEEEKINTKSQTESKLAGVGDLLARVICTQYFPKEQGYKTSYNIIY